MLSPLAVSQELEPCVLHSSHSPITVFNERHHVFPEYLQKRVWGETRDKEVQSVCSTGHNTVHGAITYYLDKAAWPAYAVGKTREMAAEAVKRYKEALDARPSLSEGSD